LVSIPPEHIKEMIASGELNGALRGQKGGALYVPALFVKAQRFVHKFIIFFFVVAEIN
jgi:hypothetical protein